MIQRVRIIRQAQTDNYGEPQQRTRSIRTKRRKEERNFGVLFVLVSMCVKTEEEVPFYTHVRM